MKDKVFTATKLKMVTFLFGFDACTFAPLMHLTEKTMPMK